MSRARYAGGGSTVLITLLLLIGFAGVGGATYLYLFERDTTELSGAAGCPVSGSPARLLVLVDTTNPVGPVQAASIRREIETAIAALPPYSYVAIGTVEVDDAAGARFAACRPPTATETSQLTANPRQRQSRHDKDFGQPLQQQLDVIMAEFSRGSVKERFSQENRLQLSGIAVQITDTELVVTLPEAITFAVGESRLNTYFASHIEYFAGLAAGLDQTKIHIVGHTDSTGDRAANYALSERRAAAVAELLMARGIRLDRIGTRGAGSDEPIADNARSDGRAMNRRVEIVMSTSSPIMEAIQALLATAKERVSPEFTTDAIIDNRSGQRLDRDRLLIVSDLLQNSDVHSFYRGQDWRSFEKSRDFHRLSRNMSGITIVPFKIARREPAIIDAAIVEDFWTRYFEHQGVSRIEKLRIIGGL